MSDALHLPSRLGALVLGKEEFDASEAAAAQSGGLGSMFHDGAKPQTLGELTGAKPRRKHRRKVTPGDPSGAVDDTEDPAADDDGEATDESGDDEAAVPPVPPVASIPLIPVGVPQEPWHHGPPPA